MKPLKKFLFLTLIFLLFAEATLAQENFVVQNIQVEGLKRITRQTVLNYVPVHAGQRLSPSDSDNILEALYNTGFFENVDVTRKGNNLVITVSERPTIARITITGNKELKTKKLLEGLKKSKITEGQIFNAFMLKAVEQAIEQQYVQIGQYQPGVVVRTTPTTDNRVNVQIDINEGEVIRVASIQIEGNHAYTKKALLKQFDLTTPTLLSWFTKSDRYTRERLDRDLEKLTSFYLDQGYLKFQINSADVDVNTQTRKAYIKIQITEGDRYKISGYEVTGRLLGQEAALQKILAAKIKSGEYFSRSQVLQAKKEIDQLYSNEGYAFATTQIEPLPNEADHAVFLKFIVKPGEQFYVRRIHFIGNNKTQNLVYRQEMRLFEAGPFSTSKLQESKRRLMNLPYVGNVEVEQSLVGDRSSRQMDLNVKVKEVPSENIKAQIGYGGNQFIYGVGFSGPNFMGTGRTFAVGLDNSEATQHYYINYVNPYFTSDGISQGFGIFYDKLNPKKLNIDSTYTMDKYGASVNFGIPVTNDYARLNFVASYENIKLHPLRDDITGQLLTTNQITSFIRKHGEAFNNTKLSVIWTYTHLDKVPFPTKGVYQSLIGEAGIPLFKHDLRYYKGRYNLTLYQPIVSDFIFTAGTGLGAGNGYGSFETLPFFLNYYAGGIDSVAGYRQNTLGPRDSTLLPNPIRCPKNQPFCPRVLVPYTSPIGGNILTVGHVGIILPQWFSENFRMTIFGHGGNVFQKKVHFNELRYSAGIRLEAQLPIVGLVQLSFAKAFHKKCTPEKRALNLCDQLESIQFGFGTSF